MTACTKGPSLAQSREKRIERLREYASELRKQVHSEEITVLEAGARLAEYAAVPHIGTGWFGRDNVRGFVSDLAAVGAGTNLLGFSTRTDEYVFLGDSSGFSSDLAERSPQVRHFIANVAMGYVGGSFAIPVSNFREFALSDMSRADYRLNAWGALGGRNLRVGETRISDFGDWMRINLGP